MYHAPWCGHCQRLGPIWEQLAYKYSDQENLQIGAFDCTTNKLERGEITRFPTIIFYPKDNKVGVKFEGKRDLEGLSKYLTDNSPVLKEVGVNPVIPNQIKEDYFDYQFDEAKLGIENLIRGN